VREKPLIAFLNSARQNMRRFQEKEIYLRRSKYQAKDEYLIMPIKASFVRYFFKFAIIVQSFEELKNVM
jgi:hypothetical protein